MVLWPENLIRAIGLSMTKIYDGGLLLESLNIPAGPQELARQNKITQQILEAYIQKKLGLASGNVRAPSIFDILPAKKTEERTIRESAKKLQAPEPEELEMEDMSEMADPPEVQEYVEDDSLQSVESEQINSVYSEGIKTIF
ncbi:jg8735 [Pararge aegeria aegeria]|uniref:Jg8735 protein n=1 Tax=Pararge aegeria aegeria TaxID=348720 RepID=A0A8S4S1Z7_9NEOP|nr:jg8735 [Pararge aegeria aegeria]